MENINILPSGRPIVKNGIRIFRPKEFKTLVDAIPKLDHRTKLEALLYTGCRYNELKSLWNRFHGKPDNAFNVNTILIPSLKPEAKHAERYVHLNSNGVYAVRYFLQSKTNLPDHPGWDMNLHRWSKKAGLDPTGVCCKSTRKTWESWLTTSYPNNYHNIILNQGHTERVSLEFYLMLPFTEDDKKDIEYYTKGWI